MFKLNNKGWSMNEMLFFWAILAFFLLIAIFYIYKFYDVIDISRKYKDEYQLLESKVAKAANQYVLQNTFDNDVNSITITLDELVIERYLDGINDIVDDTKCDGYAEVIINDKISSSGYIKCSNYETKGY